MKMTPLGDLLELSDSGVWGDEDIENGVSVLRSTNFQSNGALDFSKIAMRAIEERKREAKLLRPGDILLEKSGGGPAQPVGRVCLFKGGSQPHSFGNFIARLRPKAEVMSEYLFYFLWRFHAIGMTSHYQKQTTGIRNLELKRFLGIEVPVVPLDEQRRIVDLLSRAEGILRLRREAQQKAAELVPAIFLEMFGDPRTNSKNLPVYALGDLMLSPPTLGTMAKPSADKARWLDLRVANIQGGMLTLEDQKWLDLSEQEINRFQLVAGDVILARAIGSLDHLGKAVVVYPDGDWTFDSHLMRLRLDAQRILPEWFVPYLSSVGGRAEFLKHTRHSAVQFNINGKEIRKLQIPLPSLDAQRFFCMRTEEIRNLAAQQAIAMIKAEAAFGALLARASS